MSAAQLAALCLAGFVLTILIGFAGTQAWACAAVEWRLSGRVLARTIAGVVFFIGLMVAHWTLDLVAELDAVKIARPAALRPGPEPSPTPAALPSGVAGLVYQGGVIFPPIATPPCRAVVIATNPPRFEVECDPTPTPGVEP